MNINKIPLPTEEDIERIKNQYFQEYKESERGLLDSFVYNNIDSIRGYVELCKYLGTHNMEWYKIAVKNSKHYIGMYQKLNWKRHKMGKNQDASY